ACAVALWMQCLRDEIASAQYADAHKDQLMALARSGDAAGFVSFALALPVEHAAAFSAQVAQQLSALSAGVQAHLRKVAAAVS
ncbi:MAG TPA: hypothetical protein VHE37_16435, partial [Nevskiaceae bacterium]|nr:hypothetical protein [Nevskiaceae bacterium]